MREFLDEGWRISKVRFYVKENKRKNVSLNGLFSILVVCYYKVHFCIYKFYSCKTKNQTKIILMSELESMYNLWQSGVDQKGGGGLGGSVESHKLKKMRHYNMLT